MRQRRNQDRGKRDRRRKKRKAPAARSRAKGRAAGRPADEPGVRYYEDDTYGWIRYIEATWTDAKGAEHSYWAYDPDQKVDLPPGAVRGDIRKQRYCCSMPQFFYVDIDCVCVQCDADFVYTAREQKFWYESLQGHAWSRAVRCAACRRKRRSLKALRIELAEAVAAYQEDPGDAERALRLAVATVEHARRFESGNIDRALAAVRRAYKDVPQLHEALFWEGRLQLAAKRPAKAQVAFEAFIEVADPRGRCRRWVKQANAWLQRRVL